MKGMLTMTGSWTGDRMRGTVRRGFGEMMMWEKGECFEDGERRATRGQLDAEGGVDAQFTWRGIEGQPSILSPFHTLLALPFQLIGKGER